MINFDKLNILYENKRTNIMNIVWLAMTLIAGLSADIVCILEDFVLGAICISIIVGVLIVLVVIACLELKDTLKEIKKETDRIFVETKKEIDNMILKSLLALDRAIEREMVEINKINPDKVKEQEKKKTTAKKSTKKSK